MKKSKILVPALAVLCISTASAVSGTVAWFSANSTVTVNANNFVAVNPSAGLGATAGANVNTKLNDDGSISVGTSTVSSLKFRDASVSIASGGISVFKGVAEDGVVETYEEVDNPYHYEQNKIIYAATWKVTFTAKGSAGYYYDLFFQGNSSTFTSTTGKVFENCFRVGIYTSDKTIVWAPRRDNEASLTYVTAGGKGTSTTGTYTNVKVDAPASKTVTKAVGQAKPNFIASIEGSKSTTINFVAWYEGEDPDCIDDNEIPTDAASVAMKFTILNQTSDYKAA